MFVSSGQIFVFIACIAFGGVSGLVFFIISPFKMICKNKIIYAVLDFLCFALITYLFLLFYNRYKFPNLRAYMIIGVFLGLLCYFKSFNIILAKVQKKFYNIIKEIKINKGRNKNGRTKAKKSS